LLPLIGCGSAALGNPWFLAAQFLLKVTGCEHWPGKTEFLVSWLP
jgi:hypothetical protein